MIIDSIQNGIVIDHITAGKAMELYNILGLDKLDCTVAILKNVTSGKLGRKDIIKIDREMELDWDLIGYVDPSITVNRGNAISSFTVACGMAKALARKSSSSRRRFNDAATASRHRLISQPNCRLNVQAA